MTIDLRQQPGAFTETFQPGIGEGTDAGRKNRGELMGAIAESVSRLQGEIALQQQLVALALENCPRSGGLEALAVNCPLRFREKRLRAAIQQAIEVLEASRRAFKSKQLELLRKNLTAVLIETD